MHTLVLLPGMDGSAELFAPLIQALGNKVKVVSVSYPYTTPLNYQQLERLISDQLTDLSDFYILGESFSGPLAISIASKNQTRCLGVFLSCTFACNPVVLGKYLLPCVSLLPFHAFPSVWLKKVMWGDTPYRDLHQLFLKIYKKVSLKVWQTRLKAVLSVDVRKELSQLNMPILYLQAKQDRLVSPQALDAIKACNPLVQCQVFDTAHLLLQIQPDLSANSILAFISPKLG